MAKSRKELKEQIKLLKERIDVQANNYRAKSDLVERQDKEIRELKTTLEIVLAANDDLKLRIEEMSARSII